jgi:hypothetical protein
MKNILRAYSQIKTSFVRGSLLYGLSLDKRTSIFDQNAFISDPWPGDSLRAKEFLSGVTRIDQGDYEFDIIESIGSRKYVPLPLYLYINSFDWIRDIRLIGGTNNRKYIRNVVHQFIEDYKRTRQFWMTEAWAIDITSERIANWMFAYSFFATGSDDYFEKEILSSIAMQYSHISKMYVAEKDPISRISALRSVLLCLNAMHITRKRQITAISEELFSTIRENLFNGIGIYSTRNPRSHFYVFKILLESRLAIKNYDIEFPTDILQNMADVVRYLRMGDGSISNYQGEINSRTEFMSTITSRTIDTALSLINTHLQKDYTEMQKITGLDRISTKNTVVIINTKATSRINKGPKSNLYGIRVCEFESSFQKDKIIKNSEISILVGSNPIRIRRGKLSKVDEKREEKEISAGWVINSYFRNFQISIKRNITLSINSPRLMVTEEIQAPEYCDVLVTIELEKGIQIEDFRSNKIIFSKGNTIYEFALEQTSAQIFVPDREEQNSQLALIMIESMSEGETNRYIHWKIEKTGTKKIGLT